MLKERGFSSVIFLLVVLIVVGVIIGGSFLIKKTVLSNKTDPINSPMPVISTPTNASQTKEMTPQDLAQIQLLPPTYVLASFVNGAMYIDWMGTGEDLKNYEIYRKKYSDKTWQLLSTVQPKGDNKGPYHYKDLTTKAVVEYVYGVSAVGTNNNKSKIKESGPIEYFN